MIQFLRLAKWALVATATREVAAPLPPRIVRAQTASALILQCCTVRPYLSAIEMAMHGTAAEEIARCQNGADWMAREGREEVRGGAADRIGAAVRADTDRVSRFAEGDCEDNGLPLQEYIIRRNAGRAREEDARRTFR